MEVDGEEEKGESTTSKIVNVGLQGQPDRPK
jgi:hypothetical protein